MNNKLFYFVGLFTIFGALDILLGKWMYSQGVDPIVWVVHVYFFALIMWTGYITLKKDAQHIRGILNARWPFFLTSITAAGGVTAAYVGLSMTEAINYSFLIQLSMVFTIVFAHIRFTDEKISGKKAVLMLLFLIGVYLVATQGKTLYFQAGDRFVIVGALLFSVNNITIKECLQRGVTVPMIVWGRNIVTFLVGLCLLGILSGGLQFTPEILPYALLSACFICIRLTSLNKVIEYSSPSYMTMMSMINPVLVVIGAMILLGESITSIQVIGGGIIIVSGIVLEMIRRKNS